MFSVVFENVSKQFAQPAGDVPQWVLRDCNASVEPGQTVGIMGKSGAGKSTLIRLCNALIYPDSGRVWVDGHDVHALDRQQLRVMRRKIGMIFQHYPLIRTRTVFDNIALPLVLSATDVSRIRTAVDAMLELIQLTDRRDCYPAQLSGGQQQRVAIARALIHEPELVLADEMTSALDPDMTEEIGDWFHRVQQERGFTLITVAHDPQIVKKLCTRYWVLNQGQIRECEAV